MVAEYLTLRGPGRAEMVVKRSRFIGSALPVSTGDEADAFVASVRAEHRLATHNVYAYRAGLEVEAQRFSDDGEPAGTAGRPVLDAILGRNLRNVAVVVTRYFGGTLLGTGGLVRAYGQAAAAAIDAAGVVRQVLHCEYGAVISYGLVGPVQRLAAEHGGRVSDAEYGAEVRVRLLIPVDRAAAFRQAWTGLVAGAVGLDDLGRQYVPEQE